MPRLPVHHTISQAHDSGETPERPPADQLVEHVTPLKRDVRYDHKAEQAVLPVRVHFRDGRKVDTTLLLDPGQMQVLAIQLERAISTRQELFAKDAL
ncbi:hypothetical protein [Streptomyces sp. SYSU K217416]